MNFYQQVYRLVRQIPPGRVMTYGQIASLLSSPRAARMVGTAMRSLPEGSDIPWQRVIGRKGEITIENLEHPAEEQANRLMAEGVEVHQVQGRYVLDLGKYVWRPALSSQG